jgi:quinol monooxygenase YgiN
VTETAGQGRFALPDDVEVTIVTMRFQSADPAGLQAVLAKYVVLTRGEDGCRNVDLCLSTTSDATFVVIEKWESPDAQQAHFDGPTMVEMAQSCRGLLASPPQIDLLEGISAHDLN